MKHNESLKSELIEEARSYVEETQPKTALKTMIEGLPQPEFQRLKDSYFAISDNIDEFLIAVKGLLSYGDNILTKDKHLHRLNVQNINNQTIVDNAAELHKLIDEVQNSKMFRGLGTVL